MRQGRASTPDERERRYGVVRSTLIGYGVLAIGYLLSHTGAEPVPRALGVDASSLVIVIAGLTIQALLIVASRAVRRRVSDLDTAARTIALLELLGDGVTVFLFALATFGAITQTADQL